MTKLILAGILLLCSIPANAGDVDPSGYSLYSGGHFYVLTDGMFSPDDVIQVRFEAAGNTSLQAYGGVDVRLYRIPKPLEFLRAQKNLHRPNVKGRYEGEGLSNVLSYLWDSWYKKARLGWQRIFSSKAREEAVKLVPELKELPAHQYKTQFTNENQFKPLSGMEVVDSFRYPIWEAKPVEPPKETRMEGSSSNFIQTPAGNVMLPMGKRNPGLYLVEAMIGSFRATTLVFVSNSVAVTKVSSNQALVWTADRLNGVGRPKSKILLTDGVGIIDQGIGNEDGVYISKHEVPEHTFAMVEDENGGVAVTENFFYDAEVYQSKIYLFTDRPLYQPGDVVFVRALGRDIKRVGSRDVWGPLTSHSATLTVIDASGVPILSQKMNWAGIEGGEAQFKLPDAAESGGYSLKVRFEGEDYGAAFRVARFMKPHFEAQIIFDKPSYKVGEAVTGRVALTYPSGQPVVNAQVDLQLRAEQMTVHEGNYGYNGAAPIELKNKAYTSDSKGEVSFTFPAATKPSRYIATARAFDQAAYRVTSKKEILIEGYLETYIVTSDVSASQPGAVVRFLFDRQGTDAGEMSQKLKNWQAIRLEDRTVTFGQVAAVERGEFNIKLEKPGHYVIRVVDSGGVTRGVRSHIVFGPDLKSTSGGVEIVSDREAYEIGDTAKLIVTFPAKADDALLTLERNDISAYGRISKGSKWFRAVRVGDAQWKVEIPITEAFAPNIIFSVATALNGEFNFQNKGLVVKKPMIDITFKPSKTTYAPGEKVRLAIETKYQGKPLAALVALGVVDEMIYVLQPEIAPPIDEFFHHIRRNQVRTSSSKSFYSFNPAISDVAASESTTSHRDLKLLQERARRDLRDTAYWNGSLKTDSNGRAQVEFVMPDALTRWRMTARAISLTGPTAEIGAVGESKSYILSNQDYYLKWTGPTLFRIGDSPKPALVAFNSTGKASDAEIQITGPSYSFSQKMQIKPGVNTIVLDRAPGSQQTIESRLLVGGRKADLLDTKIDFEPLARDHSQSQLVRLEKGAKLSLPIGAHNIRLKVVPESAYEFERIADDLMDYPWGCVEQTSSRLIAMVMAANAISIAGENNQTLVRELKDQITADRRRLVSMAGPRATFTWWGDMTKGNLLMTAHAYHADFRASKFLGISIPRDDWGNLLKVYADSSGASFFEKAYALWVLSFIGEPVSEQSTALLRELGSGAETQMKPQNVEVSSSAILDSDVEYDRASALLLLGIVSAKNGIVLAPPTKGQIDQLASKRWAAPVLRAASLAYLSHTKSPGDLAGVAASIIDSIRYESATIDRSLALALIQEALPQASSIKKSVGTLEFGPEWKKVVGRMTTYEWKGKSLPKSVPTVPGGMGEIVYDGMEDTKPTLNATLTRRFLKVLFNSEVKPAGKVDNKSDGGGGAKLNVVEVKPDEAFDPRSLYVDEVKVSLAAGVGRFLLLEMPMPPGGETDSATWGMNFANLKANFVEPRSASGGLGYSIPVEEISGEKTFHQLVRFSSRGHFQLPPAKIFKMYKPIDKAYESGVNARAIDVQ